MTKFIVAAIFALAVSAEMVATRPAYAASSQTQADRSDTATAAAAEAGGGGH